MSYLINQGRYAGMVAKSNNMAGNLVLGLVPGPGLVITLGAASVDIIHLVPVGRSFYVTKIMWYSAVNATLLFETLSNALAPVPMFPLQLALAGIPGGLEEEELVGVEFMLNSNAAPLGWDGNLYVTSSVAAVQISCEVAEKL
jgi:hypothetical protein